MKTWLLVLIMVRTVSMKTWKDMEKKCQFLIKCQVQALVLDGVIAQQQPEAKYKWGQAKAWPNSIFNFFFVVFLCFIAFLFHLTTSLLPFVDSLLFHSISFLCYFVFGYFSICYSMLYFSFFCCCSLLHYSLFRVSLLYHFIIPFFIAAQFRYYLFQCAFISLLFVLICPCFVAPLFHCHYFLAICSLYLCFTPPLFSLPLVPLQIPLQFTLVASLIPSMLCCYAFGYLPCPHQYLSLPQDLFCKCWS